LIFWIRSIRFYTKDIFVGCGYSIGKYTYGRPRVIDFGEGARLVIGKFCSISAGVTIFLGGEHRTDWITTYPFPSLPTTWPEAHGIEGHPTTMGDVVIGNDVWLGRGCVILSGSRIGDGAVVGANSVVSGEIAPYSIVAGNPVKTIRKRFDEEKIARLLDIRWWDWPDNKIRKKVELLCSDKINEL
jgi:acetyltransferase-like isoleucine patch superfamily enzyme